MNCTYCKVKMLLWYDDNYHCPVCGKVIEVVKKITKINKAEEEKNDKNTT